MFWFIAFKSQAFLQRMWLFFLKNKEYLRFYEFKLDFELDFHVYKFDLLNLTIADMYITYYVD